ncbi:WSC domain-containing protein [Plectosphaerella cucumerina]|uniref:WSC domain-containing protein n=1 Tax=Plectosphaerella cucumerina TaxID=40658 RepID=A0A8K0TLF1_9PEZI|nr:WSC domain-containing protein [Plectosphaerella cucumerina]
MDCDPDDVYAGNMSNDKCVEHCSKRGYSMAGTEWSRECWCGNVFRNARRLPEVQCDSLCDGDSKDVCGGDWALTVYSRDGTGVNTISLDDNSDDDIIKAGGKKARDAAGSDRGTDGDGAAAKPPSTSFVTFERPREANPTKPPQPPVSQAPTFVTAGVGALPTAGGNSDDAGGNIFSAIQSIIQGIPSELGFGDAWADGPTESGRPGVETRDESVSRNYGDKTSHVPRKRRDVGQRASWNDTDVPQRWYKTWQG